MISPALHRPFLNRRLASRIAIGAALGAGLATGAQAHAAEQHWDLRVDDPPSRAELGLGPDASARALARAAIEHSAGRLGLEGSRVTLAPGEQRSSAGAQMLRFRQTAGGLRVVWSEIDVLVSGSRVAAINATTVPVETTRLSGERRIAARRAVRVARRAVPGPDRAAPAELVAYAGTPARPTTPRRAYVVQVAPAQGGDDVRRTLCVVVEAQTGDVIARWPGTAAMPDDARPARPRARSSAATTVLYQIANFKRKDPSGFPFGLARVLLTTTGNPVSYGDDVGLGEQFLDAPSANIDFLHRWAKPITRFLCVHPRFRLCGRTATSKGEYKRHFIVGNHTGDDTFFDPNGGGIVMGENDADDPDVLEHELGHAMDYALRNDYIGTFEAYEVDEALGDMFSNALDRDGLYQDGPKPKPGAVPNPDDVDFSAGGVLKSFGDPEHNPDPKDRAEHVNQYSCTTKDEHQNGIILSHAFHLLVNRIGYDKAGELLTYVPMALPAQREFGDVRRAFADAARGLYNGGKPNGADEKHVQASFAQVGVFDNTRRSALC